MNPIRTTNRLLAILLLGLATFCTTAERVTGVEQPVSVKSLRFLGIYELPFNTIFRSTVIGGLSGIDYDVKRQVYYLISDDRSAMNRARFYTAKIRLNDHGIQSVEITNVTTLLQANGRAYPNPSEDPAWSPDPEAIRYHPKSDQIIWSSEGERIVKKEKTVLENPAIIAVNRSGNYMDSFPIPQQLCMQESENGPRQNGTLEGITFADAYRTLYVSMEEPIYEDGPRAGLADSTSWIRIIKYDAATHTPLAQYAYKTEPVAHPASTPDGFKVNGVTDILAVSNTQMLVTERSFSAGRAGCTIRLFLADLEQAADISFVASLQQHPPTLPVTKKLLFSMDSLNLYIDNIEGATFGPSLPNGHKTILFVSDNNFSSLQKTQFLLFEVIP